MIDPALIASAMQQTPVGAAIWGAAAAVMGGTPGVLTVLSYIMQEDETERRACVRWDESEDVWAWMLQRQPTRKKISRERRRWNKQRRRVKLMRGRRR
jgi:hypothetical protein